MEKAEVRSDRGVEKSGKGRQFKTLGFHSLRHTFVSELANADVPADVRRQISGHSDEKGTLQKAPDFLRFLSCQGGG